MKESKPESLEDYIKVQKFLEDKIKHYQNELHKINSRIKEATKLLESENKQLLIAFGKYIAGYRPGDELWSDYDQGAFDIARELKTIQNKDKEAKVEN